MFLLGLRRGRNEEVVMSVDIAAADPNVLMTTWPNHQQASDEQLQKFERYAAEIFAALGLDLGTWASREVSQRFIHTLFGTMSGSGDSDGLKSPGIECQRGAACREAHVIEGPIRFLGFCERHSFPLFGHVFVGYIAHEQIMGMCKLAQLVQFLTWRFIGQETVRQQIADAVEALLQPYGVAVYLETDHQCVYTRETPRPASHWTVWRGNYSLNPSLQTEFMKMCGLGS
jgi:GTP cyclohydrolase I